MHKKNIAPNEQEALEFWKNKKILVTGGNGFLGKYVVRLLKEYSPKEIVVPRSKKYDLRNFDTCLNVFEGCDIVIHLAARVGGIGYNQKHPAEMFDDNILLGVNTLRAARFVGVDKVVIVSTICAYPKFTEVPFKEDNLWNGYPEETNAPYGIAKRVLLVQSQAYRQQYGFNSIYLLPVNLYGPGDNFNPESSHVIPALIKKFMDAVEKGESEVVLWGTGHATREFLYVKDAAYGILAATQKYNKENPVNLGSGSEISIHDLALIIQSLVGFKGKIVWDTSKPDGQPRRMLDVQVAAKEFGFKASTPFDEGLSKTFDWFLKKRDV